MRNGGEAANKTADRAGHAGRLITGARSGFLRGLRPGDRAGGSGHPEPWLQLVKSLSDGRALQGLAGGPRADTASLPSGVGSGGKKRRGLGVLILNAGCPEVPAGGPAQRPPGEKREESGPLPAALWAPGPHHMALAA